LTLYRYTKYQGVSGSGTVDHGGNLSDPSKCSQRRRRAV
jgi:hypothetical protein